MAVTYGPRTRSSSNTTLNNHQLWYRRTNSTGVETKMVDNYLFDSFNSNVMHDVVVENYKSRIAAGDLISNPMDKTDVVENSVLTEGQIIGSQYTYHGTYDHCGSCKTAFGYLGYTSAQLIAISEAKAYYNTKALAKVNSAQHEILVTMGEIKETKEMFFKTLLRLGNFTRIIENCVEKFKKFRRLPQTAKTKAELKAIGAAWTSAMNAWMEVRFGWRPCFYEMQSLYEAMNSVQKKHPKRQTFRSGGSMQIDASDTKYTGTTQKFHFSRKLKSVIKFSAGVLCEQRYGGIPDTWGLTKIPQAIWDLTSLSWAVDYFFNIGNLIASYTPDSLWSKRLGWVTTREHIEQEIKFTKYEQVGYIESWSTYGQYNKVTDVVTRSDASLYGTLIFRPRMNWAKYIDLVGVTYPHLTGAIKSLARVASGLIVNKKKNK